MVVKGDLQLTFMSLWWISILRAGRISLMVCTGGGGSLFLHRFTTTHVTLRRNEIGISGLMKLSRGWTTPSPMT